MHALIVYAHHEPRSFNAAMKDLAVATFEAAGWSVEVSDLYAEGFQAVASPADFTEASNSDRFGYLHEQRHAAPKRAYAADILHEQNRLARADFVLFQFPVWWYAPPAIVKGWVDRVLTHGFAYTDSDMFDSGLLRGKRGMVAATTGGTEEQLGGDSRITGSVDEFLRPFNGGVLRFIGMDVEPSFVAYSPASLDNSGRAALLERWRERLEDLTGIRTRASGHAVSTARS